uniref:Uncharacterized protein n=1 Tax=Anopheles farauti TaxID=69004 RepID=A0A182QC51_9DIPT
MEADGNTFQWRTTVARTVVQSAISAVSVAAEGFPVHREPLLTSSNADSSCRVITSRNTIVSSTLALSLSIGGSVSACVSSETSGARTAGTLWMLSNTFPARLLRASFWFILFGSAGAALTSRRRRPNAVCPLLQMTPLHRSTQTFTVPRNWTYVDSGNLNARNLAASRSPSTVLKFSNRYGSTEQLRSEKLVRPRAHVKVTRDQLVALADGNTERRFRGVLRDGGRYFEIPAEEGKKFFTVTNELGFEASQNGSHRAMGEKLHCGGMLSLRHERRLWTNPTAAGGLQQWLRSLRRTSCSTQTTHCWPISCQQPSQ